MNVLFQVEWPSPLTVFMETGHGTRDDEKKLALSTCPLVLSRRIVEFIIGTTNRIKQLGNAAANLQTV
jgi:hypothetical protein